MKDAPKEEAETKAEEPAPDAEPKAEAAEKPEAKADSAPDAKADSAPAPEEKAELQTSACEASGAPGVICAPPKA